MNEMGGIMTKEKDLNNIILQYGDVQPNENNVYSKLAFKRLRGDVDSVFGLIDGKTKKHIPFSEYHDDDDIKMIYYMSFLGSLVINMLFRIGMFEHDKKTYLTKMEHFYDVYHDETNIIDLEYQNE